MRNRKDVDGSIYILIFRHCCGIFWRDTGKLCEPLSEESVPQLRLKLSTSRIQGRNVSSWASISVMKFTAIVRIFHSVCNSPHSRILNQYKEQLLCLKYYKFCANFMLPLTYCSNGQNKKMLVIFVIFCMFHKTAGKFSDILLLFSFGTERIFPPFPKLRWTQFGNQ